MKLYGYERNVIRLNCATLSNICKLLTMYNCLNALLFKMKKVFDSETNKHWKSVFKQFRNTLDILKNI